MITSAIRSSRVIRNGLLVALLALTSCYPRHAQLEPNIRHVPKQCEVASMPGPFPPLLPFERKQAWALEYVIGVELGKQLDLYRAITSFKRALILLPEESDRKQQIEYDIALSYFLGDKFCETIRAVEESSLTHISSSFCAYQELMVMLYESYLETRQPDRAAMIMQQLSGETASEVAISSALRRGDLATLRRGNTPAVNHLLNEYCRCKKSVSKAQVLNAALPGAGYLYVGQRTSAVTAFLLNGLFIFGAYQFYRNGYWAAGAFTTSLELGWYFGGIYGAGEAAHLHNELLYERLTAPYVCEQNLFPSLMLRWTF